MHSSPDATEIPQDPDVTRARELCTKARTRGTLTTAEAIERGAILGRLHVKHRPNWLARQLGITPRRLAYLVAQLPQLLAREAS